MSDLEKLQEEELTLSQAMGRVVERWKKANRKMLTPRDLQAFAAEVAAEVLAPMQRRLANFAQSRELQELNSYTPDPNARPN
jgi:hypothetical protein